MRVTHASETTGGALTTVTDYRFVYGPDSLPLEMIVTSSGGTPVSYAFQCDRAGSVVALTDSAGAVVASYSYDPYGTLLATGGSDPALAGANPLRYRAYCYDEATGHYYLPARYYDPQTARFLSADPASPSAGDPLSLNRYAYCVGDPVNFHDRTGARHEAGSGVAGRVSTDAIALAKKGQLDSAKKVQARFRNAVSSNYAKGYDFVQAGRLAELSAESVAREIRWREEGRALDVAAGWLAGTCAVTATVANAAGCVALATTPAAATGVGAVVPGAAAWVAAVAGGASVVSGIIYIQVTTARAERGDIAEGDPRLSAPLGIASVSSGAIGAMSWTNPLNPGLGMIGTGTAWGTAVTEWTTY